MTVLALSVLRRSALGGDFVLLNEYWVQFNSAVSLSLVSWINAGLSWLLRFHAMFFGLLGSLSVIWRFWLFCCMNDFPALGWISSFCRCIGCMLASLLSCHFFWWDNFLAEDLQAWYQFSSEINFYSVSGLWLSVLGLASGHPWSASFLDWVSTFTFCVVCFVGSTFCPSINKALMLLASLTFRWDLQG